MFIIFQLELEKLLHKQSFSLKLERKVAWMFWFINKCRKSQQYASSSGLTCEEILRAETFLIEQCQECSYAKELKILQEGVSLPNKHHLSQYCPYLDVDGVIRVGGRLDNSNLPNYCKNSIILDHKDRYTHLLVRIHRLQMAHAGPQLLKTIIARKYDTWQMHSGKECYKRLYYLQKTVSSQGQSTNGTAF